MKLNRGDRFGDYEIVGRLGEGAMGAVFRARDSKLSREVALKLITDERAGGSSHRDQLAAEARMAASIDSPHVARVWEYSEFEGTPYVSYQYVPGTTLRQALASLEFAEKVEVARHLALGVEAIHATGLIHRDLKPENIMLTDDRQAKIVDFGIAKYVDSGTMEHMKGLAGTIHYMSPEQLSGGTLTGQSDLFSYGVILYELFTGCRPFEGDYSASVVYAILHDDPIPPTEKDESLPGWIDNVVLKSLAKDPSRRFESASEIAQAIEQAADGTGEMHLRHTYELRRKSVTVVDIANLSQDESWEYFCEGFTEDLIREISRRTELTVAAEPDTAAIRNIREIFKQCRSDYVVKGSLQRWQETIKLGLSVFADRGDRLLFGETYICGVDELFTILGKAAEETAMALAAETGGGRSTGVAPASHNVSAYDYYLRGKSYYQTSTPEGLSAAIGLYTRALEEDPDMALAHAGLSDVYTFQYMAYYDRTPERIEVARVEATKALTLGPQLPEAHRALGRCHMFMGDIQNAKACFENTIHYDPKYAIGYRTLGWLYDEEGDWERAEQYARKALQLAPTDLETLLLLGLIHTDQRNYTPALATLHRAIELGPDYGRAYYSLGLVYQRLGVVDMALENYLSATEHKGDLNSLVDAGYLYLLQGNFEAAKVQLNRSIEFGYLPFVAHYFLALVELVSADREAAAPHLEKALEVLVDYEVKDPDNQHLRGFRSLILAASGSESEARDVLRVLDEQDIHDGEVLNNIARAYSLLGDSGAAERFTDIAVRAPKGPSRTEVKMDPHFTVLPEKLKQAK